MENKNLNNNQLSEKFKEQLATTHPVVFHIQDSKNPDYLAVFIAQQKQEDEILSLFLGFGGQIVRAVQTVSKEQIKKVPVLKAMIQEGGLLKGFDVHIEDSLTPSYDDQPLKTRMRDGERVVQVTEDGEPIYRNISIIKAGSADDVIMSGKWVSDDGGFTNEEIGFDALTGAAVEAN